MIGLFNNDDQRGYTRGSLDVVTAINLFLKFLLISPILLFASYVSLAMMKHVIFQGIPSMNKPTETQEERLREADSRIGLEPPVVEEVRPAEPKEVVEPAVVPVQSKVQREEETLRRFCIDTWLPRHGNNPNAIEHGSPCFRYQ